MQLSELGAAFTAYVLAIAFVLGACIASFTACAAYRYTAHESVLRGRSHCDSCGEKLGVLDLIPVLSYIFLRGRCRKCGAKIPVSCLVTELLGGTCYLLTVWKFGLTFRALELLTVSPLLLAVSLIDLRTMEIPNGLVIATAACFPLFIFTYLPSWPEVGRKALDGLIGALALGGGLLVISLIMDKLLRRDSLGGGDIKLFGALGLLLGPWRGLITVILACIVGLVFALTAKKSNGEFPFGPAICMAAFVSLLVGNDVINIYLSLFGL